MTEFPAKNTRTSETSKKLKFEKRHGKKQPGGIFLDKHREQTNEYFLWKRHNEKELMGRYIGQVII